MLEQLIVNMYQGVGMTWGFFMQSIGQRVKALRVSKRLNQQQLADLVGVSQPAIAKIEKNITKSIKGSTLDALAIALASTPAFILRGSTGPDDHEESMMTAEMQAIFSSLPMKDKETIIRIARSMCNDHVVAKEVTA